MLKAQPRRQLLALVRYLWLVSLYCRVQLSLVLALHQLHQQILLLLLHPPFGAASFAALRSRLVADF
jgi:hypothetical protein